MVKALERQGAATLDDVAERAGVSVATASRVLNGSTRVVAASYRDRVEQAAQELGYTTNRSAQATARGTSAIIALIVADIADPYFGEIAAGVARGADEAGLSVTIGTTGRDHDRELRLISALAGLRPQGMILAASRSSDEPVDARDRELTRVEEYGGRVVLLARSDATRPVVTIDNRGGAQRLGQAMMRAGYRRTVIIAAREGVATSDDRVAGFAAAVQAAGGPEPRVYRTGFSPDDGAVAMARALEDGVAPGVLVFAISDVMAMGAMSAIRGASRSVGADIAVAGFDDIPMSRAVAPALTTVHVPLEDAGYQAMRASIDPMWAPRQFPLRTVLRESTPGVS